MSTQNRAATLLRWPSDLLHEWFKDEAKNQGRSVNAEVVMALKYWKETRKEGKTQIPEEKDLNISIADVQSDRRIIKEYENKIKNFEAKAAGASGPGRGAYRGHITKTKKNLDAMSGNLAYHLGWLKKFKPDVYEEIKQKNKPLVHNQRMGQHSIKEKR